MESKDSPNLQCLRINIQQRNNLEEHKIGHIKCTWNDQDSTLITWKKQIRRWRFGLKGSNASKVGMWKQDIVPSIHLIKTRYAYMPKYMCQMYWENKCKRYNESKKTCTSMPNENYFMHCVDCSASYEKE